MRFRCPHCGETTDTERGVIAQRTVPPDPEARALAARLRERAAELRGEMLLPFEWDAGEDVVEWLARHGIQRSMDL